MSDVEEVVEAVDNSEVVDSAESVVDTTDVVVDEEKPFFEYDYGDGKKVSFKNAGELADDYKHSSMNRSSLEAAMEKIGARAKVVDEQETRFKASELAANQFVGKYQPIDDMMKSNPQFEQAVTQLYDRLVKGGKPQSPEDFVRKIMKEELQPYEDDRAEAKKTREASAATENKKKAFDRMRESDPTFDEKLVEQYLKTYGEYPDTERDYAAAKIGWDAVRGSTSAAELERRAAQTSRKQPSVTSTPGVKTTEIDVTKMTDEEVRQAAYADVEAGRL